jgi:hypothetical protein
VPGEVLQEQEGHHACVQHSVPSRLQRGDWLDDGERISKTIKIIAIHIHAIIKKTSNGNTENQYLEYRHQVV